MTHSQILQELFSLSASCNKEIRINNNPGMEMIECRVGNSTITFYDYDPHYLHEIQMRLVRQWVNG